MALLHLWISIVYVSTMIAIFNAAGGPYPASFDCPMRQLALEFAQNIQPFLSYDQLQEIADALKGSPEARNCTISPNNLPFKPKYKHRLPSKWNDDESMPTIYISSTNGRDDISEPIFKTLQFAINYARHKYGPTIWKQIVLMDGIYYLKNTIHLNASDSNLIISNYNNQQAVISGAIPLENLQWKLYKNMTQTVNNNKNIYITLINNNSITSIPGLRVNGVRGIRSRYPNANPEIDGFGSNVTTQNWIPPTTYNPLPESWIYPYEPYRNNTYNNLFQHYNLGVGGYCDDFFDPPAGYWCSSFVQGGLSYIYRVPTGIVYNKTQLPNTPYYSNVTNGGIIHAWQRSHWSSWMFEINKYDSKSNSIVFGKGGFQGGRGNDEGKEYYIENIFDELDYENEWFYNESTKYLYYYNNITNATNNLSNIQFEATQLEVLINMTGSMENPVENIIIRGLTFKDTVITYMSPHCMPSGGDWSLQRTGAIIFDGTKNITITDNLFTRLDGIGISINRFNRNISIIKNEFFQNGETAIAVMGNTEGISFPQSNVYPQTTMGYLGTNGNQPRYLNISFNYVHELGIWEKQSSFYFQSKSCQNVIYGNIFFNGPRAGININDGFGGNTNISKNLLFNTCRESGDHGPINSWDRQVYVTKVNDGVTPSVIKAYDYIYQNFLLSNYNAIWCVDNDDASSYYSIFNNFQVYATGGLKSIWGGHSIYHFGNIFAYVQQQCFVMNIQDEQLPGFNDGYFNNICILNDEIIKNQQYGAFSPCNISNINQWPVLGNNTIYLMNKTEVKNVGLCGLTELEFQTKYNYDIGTVIYGPDQLNDSQIIQMAKTMLFQ